MKQILINAITNNLWFYILSTISIGLLITSFILPPMGIVQPSVMQAVGEIFAFASLGTVIKAIDKNKSATVTHNNTSLTVGGDKEKEEKDNEILYNRRNDC